MADLAKRGAKKRELASVPKRYGATTRQRTLETVVGKPSNDIRQLTSVQLRAARLMAQGKSVAQIAKLLADYIVPHEPDRSKQLKRTRIRIRAWARTQKFRDQLYEEALTNLDRQSGEILKGVANKAKAGRVDAARLALELTGRHAPHTEISPAQVNIVFDGVPRPQVPRQLEDGEVIDVDAEVEPDED